MRALFASLLVAALALSGCADDFVTDPAPIHSSDPAAAAARSGEASTAKAIGSGWCSVRVVGPSSLGANAVGTYDVRGSSPACGELTVLSWTAEPGTIVSRGGSYARVRAPASSTNGRMLVSAAGYDGAGRFFNARRTVTIPTPSQPATISVSLQNTGQGLRVTGNYSACGLQNHDYVVFERDFLGDPPVGYSNLRTFTSGTCSITDPGLVLTNDFRDSTVRYRVRVVGMSGETLAQGQSSVALVEPSF